MKQLPEINASFENLYEMLLGPMDLDIGRK